MPIAISVNMLRLRVTTDCQPRTKNGQPAHSTTGVASASCIQFDRVLVDPAGARRRDAPPISSTTTGTVSASADPEAARHVGELGIGRRSRRSRSPAPAPCRRSGRSRARPGGSRDASGRCRSCLPAPAPAARGFAEIFRRIGDEFGAAAGGAEVVGVRPGARARCGVVCGSTVMPQTGSMTRARPSAAVAALKRMVACVAMRAHGLRS